MKKIVRKTIDYYKGHGLSATISKIQAKLSGRTDVKYDDLQKAKADIYASWRKKHSLTNEELKHQKNIKFSQEPLISIVVPTYNTNPRYLQELIDSIVNQTYSKWELCFADGHSNNKNTLDCLELNEVNDSRVHVIYLPNNYGISGNTNEAIKLSQGKYVAFSDHDDTWEPNALFEIVSAINKTEADLIYTDEDKVNDDSAIYYDPHLKPDYSPDKLRSCNYICHLMVVSRSILNKVGFLDSRFDGSQDHELALRICDSTTNIVHIPLVLYHWRQFNTSMSKQHLAICQAHGRRAVQEHLQRLGWKGQVVQDFCYRTKYVIQRPSLISIIIVAHGDIDKLLVRLKSLREFSSYPELEFLIITNHKDTFKASDIKVLYYDNSSDYAMRNFAVSKAQGDYLLFMDENLKPLNKEWLKELVMLAQRDDVGAVGSKLFYPDEKLIYSTEYLFMSNGQKIVPNFQGQSRYVLGYAGWERILRNVTALPIWLLMTKKKDFLKTGGFAGTFAAGGADIGYCLQLLTLGKRNVYTPYAEMKFLKVPKFEQLSKVAVDVLNSEFSGKPIDKYGRVPVEKDI